MMTRLLQSLFLVLALLSLCSATEQICDRLIYDSNEYSGDYDEFPLEDYWSDEHPKPNWLSWTHTACYRGYIATWEVRNESLFLKSLSREDNPIDGEKPISLQRVFPGANGPVPANWFSGVLHCNRGKDFNERLFLSIHEGKVIGKRITTKEQLKNPSYQDLTWSSLLIPGKIARAPLTRKWRLRGNQWIDGGDMFSPDGPLSSGKSFKLRGIYFPGGKLWTAPVSYHFMIEAPDSLKLPKIVIPVEVTAQLKRWQTDSYHLAASRIKVLPVGSAIQGGSNNLEILIGQIIIIILIGSFLVRFGIGIFGRKKGVSIWRCVFAGPYAYRNIDRCVQAQLAILFLIVSWLFLLSFVAFVIYLGALYLCG